MLIFRNSRSQIFFEIDILKNFAIFTGNKTLKPLKAFFYRTPALAASEFWQQQILFFSGIWYLLLTAAPVFATNVFENRS